MRNKVGANQARRSTLCLAHQGCLLKQGKSRARPGPGQFASGGTQVLRTNGQALDTPAGGSENRVSDGGRDSRRRCLADAARLLCARHDMHLHLGHLVHPQYRVIVEVRLLDAPVPDRDLLTERSIEPKDDAALHLCLDTFRQAAACPSRRAPQQAPKHPADAAHRRAAAAETRRDPLRLRRRPRQ